MTKMKPYYSEGGITIYHGDCRDVLAQLAANSVHCVVTSPPYWGLRDYGVDGQLGLETTPELYVQHMVEVFREVRRVLRSDGTCWLNLGDSYAAARGGSTPPAETLAGGVGGWADDGERVNRGRHNGYNPSRNAQAIGLKHKDLVGIPWRVAFALQADGWWLRSDIIWHKPNPMPESVTDRPTKAHEYVFLLTKSARYYYDAEAIREPHKETSLARYEYGHNAPDDPTGKVAGAAVTGAFQCERMGDHVNPAGRNKRTVWTVATQPFSGAHFATFPEALVEPCILAGTSERGCCPECGKSWERVVEREHVGDNLGLRDDNPRAGVRGSGLARPPQTVAHKEYLGWRPTCQHNLDPVPCVVLDPFSGSGTTGRVAVRHRRRYIGIELKAEYIELDRADNTQVVLPLGV